MTTNATTAIHFYFFAEERLSSIGKNVVAMALAPDQRAPPSSAMTRGELGLHPRSPAARSRTRGFPPRRDRLDVLDVQRDTPGLRDSRGSGGRSGACRAGLVSRSSGAARTGGGPAGAIIHDQRQWRVAVPRRYPIHARPKVSWSWRRTSRGPRARLAPPAPEPQRDLKDGQRPLRHASLAGRYFRGLQRADRGLRGFVVSPTLTNCTELWRALHSSGEDAEKTLNRSLQ